MKGRIKAARRDPRVRRVAIPAYRLYARSMVFLPPPRVFANSMPKAGTHLLMAVLDGLPRMMFSGVHHALTDFRPGTDGLPPDPSEVDWRRVAASMRVVRGGQYMTAHFPYSLDAAELLEVMGYRSILILRDPRDTVVSQSFYLSTLERHPQYRRYTEVLKTPEERLMVSIRGARPDEYGPGVPSVGERVRRYAAWTGRPEVLVTRFESLVGGGGGGDDDEQLQQLAAIAQHVQRPLAPERLEQLAGRIRTPAAATFRRGVIGDWVNHFTDEHRSAFKEEIGDLLVTLGYEQSLDW